MRRVALASNSPVCQAIIRLNTTILMRSQIEQGAIGSVGQKIGGPFDKGGMIGKQFTPEGSIGGAVQNAMGGEKEAKK